PARVSFAFHSAKSHVPYNYRSRKTSEQLLPLLPWSTVLPEYCHLPCFFEHLGFEVLLFFAFTGDY
ncbi:MAG: hypothetical protein ACLS5S_06380, partial [Faecalibacterium sp.]